jgi:platelet-activating factor acetylhydrolase IB subunit alpha
VCERCQNLDDVLGTGGKGQGDGLPREPQKFVLTGHRSRITKLALHPSYSLVASAGEDACIRIWDYEQGEHERTLKSHTGKVSYVAFSPNG